MLITFWDTAEQADASAETGWYPEVLAEFTTLFRAPPGRERYEVRVAVPPVTGRRRAVRTRSWNASSVFPRARSPSCLAVVLVARGRRPHRARAAQPRVPEDRAAQHPAPARSERADRASA